MIITIIKIIIVIIIMIMMVIKIVMIEIIIITDVMVIMKMIYIGAGCYIFQHQLGMNNDKKSAKMKVYFFKRYVHYL